MVSSIQTPSIGWAVNINIVTAKLTKHPLYIFFYFFATFTNDTEQASEDSNIGIKTEIPDIIKEETTKLSTENKEIKDDDDEVASEKLGKRLIWK